MSGFTGRRKQLCVDAMIDAVNGSGIGRYGSEVATIILGARDHESSAGNLLGELSSIRYVDVFRMGSEAERQSTDLAGKKSH